jgi:hypothetical protein
MCCMFAKLLFLLLSLWVVLWSDLDNIFWYAVTQKKWTNLFYNY